MGVHYYPLVNKIFNHFNLRNRLALPVKPTQSSFHKPFITISREPGSGGAPIAKLVAEKLGFTFVDEQIVDQIASSIQKRKVVIQAVDEKSRNAINDIVQSVFDAEYVHDLRYVKELVRLILIYAHDGHCVIVGRGANFITPSAYGLHVRITAPYNVRVTRSIEYEGYTKEKAKEIIKNVEIERRDFVKQYFGFNIKTSNAYDLTINTNYFNIEDSRDIIVKAFCHKFKRSFRYKALLK